MKKYIIHGEIVQAETADEAERLALAAIAGRNRQEARLSIEDAARGIDEGDDEGDTDLDPPDQDLN